MQTLKTDICIIGGGAGGLALAAGAAQMGARVVIVERSAMGGDCLNYGCVPSKSLLAAATLAHDMRNAAVFGLPASARQIKQEKVLAHVHSVIAAIAPHDSVERFESLGCRVIKGSACFSDRHTIIAGNNFVRAKFFVLATGSKPFLPPMEGLDKVPFFTNETIFSHKEQIEHLIVVGGGPIGLELAQAHHRLGARVSVIERSALLIREDPEIGSMLIERLQQEGIEFFANHDIQSISGRRGQIAVTVVSQQSEKSRILKGSHVLVATGRMPQLQGLGLEKAGIAYTRRGVTVDNRLRTTRRRIYAIGDCAGGMQFTHVAGYHAGVVLKNILLGRLGGKASTDHVPIVTYCDPELASVGLTEKAARIAYGDSVTATSFDFEENDRAQAVHAAFGKIKVFTRRGKIVGVTILGRDAGELLAPWILAMDMGLKISRIAASIAAYPTLSEVNKRVAGQYFVPILFSKRTRSIVRFLMAVRF